MASVSWHLCILKSLLWLFPQHCVSRAFPLIRKERKPFLALDSCPVLPSASHSPLPFFQVCRGCSSRAERHHAGDTIFQKEALPGGQTRGQLRGSPTSLPALQSGLPGILPCKVTVPWTGVLLLPSECRLISCSVLLHKIHSNFYSKNWTRALCSANSCLSFYY